MPLTKYLIIPILFFILSLTQASFFPHFNYLGRGLNLLFILVFLISFLEMREKKFGIYSAVFAGIFLDFFSGFIFGVFIISFVLIAFLIKKLVPFFERASFFSFFVVFSISFIFFLIFSNALGLGINSILQKKFLLFENINFTGACFLYFLNLFFAFLGFLIYGLFSNKTQRK